MIAPTVVLALALSQSSETTCPLHTRLPVCAFTTAPIQSKPTPLQPPLTTTTEPSTNLIPPDHALCQNTQRRSANGRHVTEQNDSVSSVVSQCD